ncbi:glycoside hydrolase family 76 protein [Nocardia fluminea]|uniref:Putative alpha-1,6-mannanase (GH76 family) n=1 Tax=Nocardia fluminea TaxID=134984 RepID=A0A2N3VL16_9NOCA|nr:glycoside hydrolase family 76 protein [Nocardia fluminea]PKV82313.1 putative alpha-1,6-mannanase (GH76 family) [Nocardia fluminea]
MDRLNQEFSRRSVLCAAGAAIALTAVAQPSQAGTITRRYSADIGPGERADLAEQAIVRRHVHSLLGLPDYRLGVLAWPADLAERSMLGRWCYWWQAHLLDCAIDAAHRTRTPDRIDRVVALARGIRVRNVTGWTNRYYDDMGWLALALERAERLLDVRFGNAIGSLRDALLDGWNPDVGAVPWRDGDDFYNTPAIGPTGLAFARLGELSRAVQLADFLHTRLRDTDSGLIYDGVHEPGGRLDRTLHTYCQGVTIGLEAELAQRTGESVHRARAAALIAAVEHRLTDEGVIIAAAGNDSGLFMGIFARFLAEAALSLDNTTAAAIVHASARAAWENRVDVNGLPLFGADWTRPVTVPEHPGTFLQLADASAASSVNLSRDLSVQLSAWMLLEADYRLTAAGH